MSYALISSLINLTVAGLIGYGIYRARQVFESFQRRECDENKGGNSRGER